MVNDERIIAVWSTNAHIRKAFSEFFETRNEKTAVCFADMYQMLEAVSKGQVKGAILLKSNPEESMRSTLVEHMTSSYPVWMQENADSLPICIDIPYYELAEIVLQHIRDLSASIAIEGISKQP